MLLHERRQDVRARVEPSLSRVAPAHGQIVDASGYRDVTGEAQRAGAEGEDLQIRIRSDVEVLPVPRQDVKSRDAATNHNAPCFLSRLPSRRRRSRRGQNEGEARGKGPPRRCHDAHRRRAGVGILTRERRGKAVPRRCNDALRCRAGEGISTTTDATLTIRSRKVRPRALTVARWAKIAAVPVSPRRETTQGARNATTRASTKSKPRERSGI